MSNQHFHRHPLIFKQFKRGNKYLRGPPEADRQWIEIDSSADSDIPFLNQQLQNSYKCVICIEIITEPVSIGCSGGHIFCKTCIYQTLRANSTNNSVSTCPTCRDPFTRGEIRDDNFAKRMIGDLKIKCPNHKITPKRNTLIGQKIASQNQTSTNIRRASRERNNSRGRSRSRSRSRSRDRNENKDNGVTAATCDWNGEYRNLSQHLLVCEFGIIPCERCSKPILRNEIHSHKTICPWLILRCNECNNNYFRCDTHSCPLEIINCRYCTKPFKRNEMKIHWKTCKKKPIPCEFYELGCRRRSIQREKMQKHLIDEQANHLLMVRNKCNDFEELETKYEELQENYDTLEQEHEELQENYEDLETKYEELNENHCALVNKVSRIERITTHLVNRVNQMV
eukprot:74356_1